LKNTGFQFALENLQSEIVTVTAQEI